MPIDPNEFEINSLNRRMALAEKALKEGSRGRARFHYETARRKAQAIVWERQDITYFGKPCPWFTQAERIYLDANATLNELGDR